MEIKKTGEGQRFLHFPIADIRSLSDLTDREVKAGAATLVQNAAFRVTCKSCEDPARTGVGVGNIRTILRQHSFLSGSVACTNTAFSSSGREVEND